MTDAPSAPAEPRQQSSFLRNVGPGIVSGAANDDPVAITTYLQVGATHGYGLMWLIGLCFPLMWLVHETAARIGRTTGSGLAANIRDLAPRWLLNLCVLVLILANTLQIGANLAMMGESMVLVLGGEGLPWVVGFGVVSLLLQIFLSYERYVAILQWATLSLLSYVAAVLLIDVSWTSALGGLVPSLTFDARTLASIVAVLGVSLSPYVLFWQANHEAEHQRVLPHRRPLLKAPEQGGAALSRIRLSTAVGMAVATVVALSIVLTSAGALHQQGITEITTSAAAAKALEPVAGPLAAIVFAAGIIGTGFLAIPVLAASTGYAVGETIGRRVGLGRHFNQARSFYGAIIAATAGGAGLNLLGVNAIDAVFWSATLSGLAIVPILALTVLVAARRDLMGAFTIGRLLLLAALGAVLIVTIAAVALVWTMIAAQFG
jgi:Mn2+/Fe2+ NRAMP family transporter